MKKKTRYTDAPKEIAEAIRSGKVVSGDFLPSPAEFRKNPPKTEISITLNDKRIKLLKKHSKKTNIDYQKVVNKAVDEYIQRFGS